MKDSREIQPPTRYGRRRFIGQSVCAGFSLSGLLSTLGTLRLFNAALSAQSVPQDEGKALVCLFLYGGNDANNLIIPYDNANYASYARQRSVLALPRDSLLPLTLPRTDGRDFALHPALKELVPIFHAGKMAVVCNVGTLLAPLTKKEYQAGSAALPPYLFSHADQQLQWQTSVPDSLHNTGWGGRLADLLQSLNAGSQLSMNISIAGFNIFQTGEQVTPYTLTTEGSIGFRQAEATWPPVPQLYEASRNIIGKSYGHVFEQEYANVMKKAVANEALLKTVLSDIPDYKSKFTRSADQVGNLNPVAAQLHMILRMIMAQKRLGMKRQIFFASLGGFDTHDAQLRDHETLLTRLATAIADFYYVAEELGVSEKVTLFTASDFNRTYNSNGNGSDHAWGGHHFVVGGAVKGGRFYGQMPVLDIEGPDDAGNRGMWIPRISTDEMAATLARWFGVSDNDLPLVLPNIHRFAQPDLGFMKMT